MMNRQRTVVVLLFRIETKLLPRFEQTTRIKQNYKQDLTNGVSNIGRGRFKTTTVTE